MLIIVVGLNYFVLKMLRRHLILFLLFLQICAVSQEMPTHFSDILKMEDYRSAQLLGTINTRVLLSLNHEDRIKLLTFDEDLQLKKETLLRFNYRLNHQDLFIHQDTIYHLYVRKNGVQALFECQRLNENLEPIDTTLLHYESYRFRFNSYYGFTEEESPTYCLFRKDRDNHLKVMRFAKSPLRMIDTTRLNMNNFELNETNIHGTMDLKGDVYFGVNKNTNTIKKNHSEWQVFKIGKQDDRVYQIKMTNQLNNSATIQYDELSQRLIIAGYYGTQSEDLSAGIYRILINFDLGDWSVNHNSFDKETILEMTGKKRTPKNLIPFIEAKEIVLRKDGGFLLLGEHERITTKMNDISMTGVALASRKEFFLEHLLISSFDQNFSPEWNQVVFKRQHSQNDDAKYSSFLLFHSIDQLHILVNDEVTTKNTMSKYDIHPSGRVMRRHFVPLGIEQPNIDFRNGIQPSLNTLYVLEYPKPSKFRLLAFNLQEHQ